MTVAHDRFELRREYPAAVDRVFAHWADPELKRRWFSEPGNHHESDFRIGGAEINRGKSPAGSSIAYLGRYSDIVTDERIVYTYDLLAEDALLSASLVSVEFAPAPTGTALTLVEQLVLLDQRDRGEYRQAGLTTQLDRLAANLTR